MTSATLSRRAFLTTSGAALGLPLAIKPTSAAANPLYQARTIVTGLRDETRIPGLRRCLPQVLIRVSGDPRLETHPLMAEIVKAPEDAAAHSSFRDLYAFRPIKDEQGTRDRPYEMTVEYDDTKINDLLTKLGSRPWLAERPHLVVFLAVQHIGSNYILSTTNDAGGLQRESFEDAAWRYAMPVNIPSERMLELSKLSFDNLAKTTLSSLQDLLDTSVSQRALSGTLRWSRELLGWNSEWRLQHQGTEHDWAVKGGNFDLAFRKAIGGAAQILSGNGAPG